MFVCAHAKASLTGGNWPTTADTTKPRAGNDAKLPVKDWQPIKPGHGIFSLAGAALVWFAQTTGVAPAIAPAVLDRLLPESLKLDGLLSVWQGSSGGGT